MHWTTAKVLNMKVRKAESRRLGYISFFSSWRVSLTEQEEKKFEELGV